MKRVLIALLTLSLLGGYAPARVDAVSPPVLTQEQIDWAVSEAGFHFLEYSDLAEDGFTVSILLFEDGSGRGVAIFGTVDFVAAVWRAFNLMDTNELAFVRENTHVVRQPALGWTHASVEKGITYVNDDQIRSLAEEFGRVDPLGLGPMLPGRNSADIILAGALIHEADHHYDWKSCRPAGGTAAEARAISRELIFYLRYDVDAWAQTRRESIGTHGAEFDPEDWIKPGCDATSSGR